MWVATDCTEISKVALTHSVQAVRLTLLVAARRLVPITISNLWFIESLIDADRFKFDAVA